MQTEEDGNEEHKDRNDGTGKKVMERATGVRRFTDKADFANKYEEQKSPYKSRQH